MDLICFANDWHGDPLSKQHLMRRLARRGARVLWVNSLGNRAPRLGNRADWGRALDKLSRFARSVGQGPRLVEENMWVIDPIAAPAYGSRLAARANALAVGFHVRAAAATLGFRRPIHYTFVPASAWVAGRLGEARLVYHAADEYGAFGGADRRAVSALEDALLARADLYVACSAPLFAAKAPRCRRAFLLRHGVEHAHWARALDPTLPVADELGDAARPIVGFIGLVAEWVDLALVEKVADALARTGGGTVVLVGGTRGADAARLETLRRRADVRIVGRKPYAELPRWARGFDVALLPFARTELTEAANPLKLREYLAAGLPVVSTDLPEARALARRVEPEAPGALAVASTAEDFVAAVLRHARAQDAGPQAARSRAVEGESWDAKAAELEVQLATLLGARGTRPEARTS